MKEVVYHPKVPAEVRALLRYYESISPRLGDAFWEELLAAIHKARACDTDWTMSKKSILAVLIVSTVLLLTPLAGNTFVEGWDWNAGAFVYVWVMMAGVGFAYLFATQRAGASPTASPRASP